MYSKYHYIYDIKERLSDYSDDSEISLEHISFLIDETRALVIKQSYQGVGVPVPNTVKQQINLDLQLVQENDFFNLDKILRTKNPIPRLIEGSKLSEAVKVDNGSYRDVKFIRKSNEAFVWVGSNKYLQPFVYWTLGVDYNLYFMAGNKNHRIMENSRLFGVFENPKEAWKASVDYDENIDFNDTIYPIDSDMWVKISDIIIKQLQVKFQIPEDKVNDAND